MDLKICKNCNNDIPKSTISRLCKKCSLENSRELYHKRKKKKYCKQCDVEFMGKSGERNCENCRRKRQPKLKEFLQKEVCPQCFSIVGFIPKKITKSYEEYLSGRVCFECQNLNRIKQSEKMQGDNNPMIKKYGRADVKIKMTPKEVSKLNSDRMRLNNPMKDPEIAKRAGRTLSQGYADGSIHKIQGPDHWLYKGSKKNFITKIKSRLYKPWVYPILKRDNFRCVFCGIGGQLEVHHLIPFREFIQNCLRGKEIHDLSDQEFEDLKQCVIDAHHLDDGITVCIPCHRKVDIHRR